MKLSRSIPFLIDPLEDRYEGHVDGKGWRNISFEIISCFCRSPPNALDHCPVHYDSMADRIQLRRLNVKTVKVGIPSQYLLIHNFTLIHRRVSHCICSCEEPSVLAR